MKIQFFVRRHTLRIFFAGIATIALATLAFYVSNFARVEAKTNTNAENFLVKRDLVIEWVALVDSGQQWDKIAEANERRASYERGGGNPITKIEWTDYRIVKLPGNKYQVSVGLHKTKQELLKIIERWQKYDSDTHFEILKLTHHGEANVFADASDQSIQYTKYSGNVADSEDK